jgi:hypothetical protein
MRDKRDGLVWSRPVRVGKLSYFAQNFHPSRIGYVLGYPRTFFIGIARLSLCRCRHPSTRLIDIAFVCLVSGVEVNNFGGQI